jgi:EAL domain-containing protein (putative c-di-GMP-specific phosphodiesterase class I)
MRPRAIARLELETELRHAVDRHELRLYYQPIRALSTSALIGFEALVRWQHPTRGLIMPNDFIPLAEEVGLIIPLGAWVMQEAGRTLKRWHEQYPVHSTLTVSVNLSGEQLKHPSCLQHVADTITTTGVRAQTMKFEITESVLIEQTEATLNQIAHIQELGIGFYLDDFGTGYSSLSYLRRFNVERLKIDRSFISRIEHSPKDLSMVRNMIRLAHGLDMQVIAEGVETPAQLEHLKHVRCDYVQGYYFSKPLPAEEAEALLVEKEI